MFKDNTVFVIGAGASDEFNLPVGGKLLSTIKQNSRFRFDYGLKEGVREIYDAIRLRYEHQNDEINARFEACAEIYRAIDSAGSIDSFIDRNNHVPHIAEVGKLQIAYAIAKAEGASKLAVSRDGSKRDLNWESLDKTWIATFARALFDGVRTTDVASLGNNITIICFNYDRCVEFYLIAAIERSFYKVSREQAYMIVNNMQIIHPYGTLGRLPQGLTDRDYIPYGPDLDRLDLWKISESLVTWSESIRDAQQVDAIKAAITKARAIVFLGFAFANQNMRLLEADIPGGKPYHTKVYSTGYGVPTQVEGTLKEKIARLYSPQRVDEFMARYIQIEHGQKCVDFMNTHLLNLMQ
ncbi:MULTISPECIES: hypothetical protein [unclassified Rhizobium]|uniref:hypothetical protein n=1 Tax=unclassified Rhizobium TaxID=2613769 RepID=UPI000EA9F6A3|nr:MULTISPECIES: hypothetical protein [unclassified Rhizobium]AYG66980.1 hypothetical protein CCGE531_13945 [Rhizobium sp. CCGE531]AYG73361.1 hypothetical protein CCGE532_13365 [Rhizobium sp. CCGE532]